VDEQKKRLEAFCEAKGWTDYEEFVDAGWSGSNMERPALQELIKRADEFDVVLVYKLDRLGRNQRDILYLIEDVFKNFNSITENFDTSTPVGKLMLSMM
jgi:site-specific DNA recombinase